MKKVALFLANGFEEIEALATVDILRRAQIPVETISISNDKTVIGAHNVPVIADKIFQETDFSEMEVLVLPGGMPGAKHLNENEALKKLIIKFNDEGKQITAICAAPIVLGGLGLLRGKRATCYPGFEAELTGAQTTGENVVVDGNITTGRGPGLAFDFGLRLVEQIAGLKTRQEVQNGLLL
ncbi:MAG: DJ-1 family glyoxalase III [Proteiniphilum sp.]|uniref:DJ-1 family glyoxalase III n=1 Tax=Proteiniphilum sp. TaxID=1926877 RepID=UPI002B21D56C|nr:DJ-1 family glyoxalase III [Proteiniphilum sp.]MEA5129849.1 DJ-1 family glyoxalase III [Proteiniphilum sp.]